MGNIAGKIWGKTELIEANGSCEFHRIDFLPGSERMSAILPEEKLEDSNQRIKTNFRIPKLYSF